MSEAEVLRDEGIQQVTSNNQEWMIEALDIIARLDNKPRTGEDIRHVVERVVGPPQHHNAYGALISCAQKRNLISATGEWVQMKDPKSHA